MCFEGKEGHGDFQKKMKNRKLGGGMQRENFCWLKHYPYGDTLTAQLGVPTSPVR